MANKSSSITLRRSSTSMALGLLLLFTSLVDVLGHEHAPGQERASFECAIDHERPHETRADEPGAHLEAAGEHHDHQCLGCRLGGHRIALRAPGATVDGAASAVLSLSTVRLPRAERPETSRTLRGPPTA